MADLQSITIKDVELRWPHLAEPSTKGEFASNKYEVFVVMDKKNANAVGKLKAIGNGTRAIVKANQYVGFKGKVFLGLNAVMITELHEYSGGDPFSDIKVDADDSITDDDDLI